MKNIAEFPQKQGKVGYKNPPKQSQFKPGQSGNPGGLPRGTPKVSIALMKLLAANPDEEFRPKSRAEKIAWALYQKASNGDVSAIRELSDRSEGKSPATINVNKGDGNAERYKQMAEELAAKYDKPLMDVVQDIIQREPEASTYFDDWLM